MVYDFILYNFTLHIGTVSKHYLKWEIHLPDDDAEIHSKLKHFYLQVLADPFNINTFLWTVFV